MCEVLYLRVVLRQTLRTAYGRSYEASYGRTEKLPYGSTYKHPDKNFVLGLFGVAEVSRREAEQGVLADCIAEFKSWFGGDRSLKMKS